jgi:glycosyltransferase involved in cell wall biosynthesis
MHILKTVQAYEPFREMGGAVVKVRAIARGLRERGHQITVLTADLGLDRLSGLSAEYTSSPWGRQVVHGGVHAIYLPTRARYRALTFNPAVRSFLRENLRQFDVVHIYGMYDLIGPATASACRSLDVPYVLEPMGMFRPIVRNIALKRLYHWIWGTRMAQGARRVIATSPMEATDLDDDGIPHGKIIVRRNGIEMPSSLPPSGLFRSRWKIPADAALILFLGRVVSKKSPDLLMEAFAAWRSNSSRGGSAVLVVAGPHEHDGYYQTLQRMASKLGIENHVLFTGPVFDADKWSAYRDADVFVLPSLDENFGNSAGESVAAGVPVILTTRCGIAPLLDGRGAFVIPHDRDKLRDALHRLLDNPSARREVAAACDQSARDLSWDLPLDQLEALYARMAAKPSLAFA